MDSYSSVLGGIITTLVMIAFFFYSFYILLDIFYTQNIIIVDWEDSIGYNDYNETSNSYEQKCDD